MSTHKLHLPRLAASLLAFLVAWNPSGVEASTLPTPSAAQVTVCVADGRGRPVVGATVVIAGTLFGAASDDSGCVRFDGVTPGSYILRVQRDGFLPHERRIVVSGAVPTAVEVSLQTKRPPWTYPGLTDESLSILPPDHRLSDYGPAPTAPRSGDASGLFDTFSLLRLFSSARLTDGHVPLHDRSRTGSVGRRTAFIAGPLSERLLQLPSHEQLASGWSASSDALLRSTWGDAGPQVRPYVGATAMSNTGQFVIEAGGTRTREDRGGRLRVTSVMLPAYRDGGDRRADTQYQGNRASGGGFVEFDRTRLDVGLDAYVETRGETASTNVAGDSVSVGGQGDVAFAGFSLGDAAVAELRASLRRRTADARTTVGVGVSVRIVEDAWSAKSGEDLFQPDLKGDYVGRAAAVRLTAERSLSARTRASAYVSSEARTHSGYVSADPLLQIPAGQFPDATDVSVDGGFGFAFAGSRVALSSLLGLTVLSQRVGGDASDTDGVTVFPDAHLLLQYRRGRVNFAYEVHHAQREVAYETRLTQPSLVFLGQRIGFSVRASPVDRLRSTFQRLGFSATRGDVQVEAAFALDHLHELPGAVRREGNPLLTTISDCGVVSTVSVGAVWSPIGLLRSGLVAHVLRSRSFILDEPMPSLPSSIVGGFVEVGPEDGVPFVRWTTMRRLERTRISESVAERTTPASTISDLEFGARRGRVVVALGVLNIGNRVARDHAFVQPVSSEPINLPGRRWLVRVRMDLG